VVNIRTAGAASKCSGANAIRIRILIRPNSLKLLFGTTLIIMQLKLQSEFDTKGVILTGQRRLRFGSVRFTLVQYGVC